MNRTALPLFAVASAIAVAAAAGACSKPTETTSAPANATSGSAAIAPAAVSAPKAAVFDAAMLTPYTALPAAPAANDKTALGKMLYFETRLSKNHDLSCNSCHKLDAFGADGQPTSPGHKKQLGSRNSPTVLNASLHFRQFWDGRAETVEEQATGPIANPVEMASDEKRVVETLTSIPEYVAAFKKVYPDQKEPITLKNVGDAIGAYERLLLTPSKWDKYLGGDKAALSKDELDGFATFVSAGCGACHAGPVLGGAMYMKTGIIKPWPNLKDEGRFAVTKADADKMMFKVPSLRNVTKTAPFFHDGSVKDLSEAVKVMARHQLGKELSDDETKKIVLFLEALTAAPAADLIAPPALPKSGDKTPKPDAT